MQYRTKCLSVGIALTVCSIAHGWTIWEEMEAHFDHVFGRPFHTQCQLRSVSTTPSPLLSYEIAHDKQGHTLRVRVDDFAHKESTLSLNNTADELTVQSDAGNSLTVSRTKDGVAFTLETDSTTEHKSDTSYYKSSSATQSIQTMRLKGEADFENPTPLKRDKVARSIEFSIPLRNVAAKKQPDGDNVEHDIEIIPFKSLTEK